SVDRNALLSARFGLYVAQPRIERDVEVIKLVDRSFKRSEHFGVGRVQRVGRVDRVGRIERDLELEAAGFGEEMEKMRPAAVEVDLEVPCGQRIACLCKLCLA